MNIKDDVNYHGIFNPDEFSGTVEFPDVR